MAQVLSRKAPETQSEIISVIVSGQMVVCLWPSGKITSSPRRELTLVAPHFAIPRDYLSDIPIARYGVFGVSTWPIGCNTPSPFSERFPLGEHAKWRCDTPPLKRGISAILARYPMKTRQMGAIPPSAILSRKGMARCGGVSRTGPLRNSLINLASPCPK